MKIAAIIAEYNPFHNGHAAHIARTRAAGYDKVVCVMGGHLTQRGEFAALSKWDRARAALMCGADAVFELPALYACRTADKFAGAGAYLAWALGADALSFGCETDDLSLIRRMADAEEDETFRAALAEGLARGESQPRAAFRATARALNLPEDAVPRGPNAILAVEYCRALRRLGETAPQPLAILRREDYHSPETGRMASAGALRAAVADGRLAEAAEGVPEEARFQIELMSARHGIDDLYLNALRTLGAEGLAKLPDVSEGLENRMFEAARESAALEEVLERAKCKRYTRARLMRLATHALTSLIAEQAQSCAKPGYLRLIGLRGSDVLREIIARARLPIRQAVELKNDPTFAYECRATDLWALTRTRPDERRMAQEFTRKFIRIS